MQNQRKVKISDLRVCATNNVRFIVPRFHSCPINSLPVELLSRIFEFACRINTGKDNTGDSLPYWNDSSFESLEPGRDYVWINGYIQVKKTDIVSIDDNSDSESFRITIALVCRHWHQVAISTPSLWTVINLHFDRLRYSLEDLQILLARSGVLPIACDICFYMESDPPEDELEDPNTVFPRVEQQFIDFLGRLAPRIRTLTLLHCRLSWSEPWISFLSNLTSLRLDQPDEDVRPSWPQLISMLRGVPALKRLILRAAGPHWKDDFRGVADAPVPLLHLTDLVLTEETSECVTGLLLNLYMPALKRLYLDLDNEYDDYTTFIDQLVGPAAPPTTSSATEGQYSLLGQLEHLHIERLYCRMTTLERLFDGMLNVKLLQICLSNLDHFKPVLHPSSEQGKITIRVPRLETLIVCHHAGTSNIAREVANRRADMGFPLKSLHIRIAERFLDQELDDDITWLKENLESFSFF